MSLHTEQALLFIQGMRVKNSGLTAGSFTLILYSAQDSDYLETVAILDIEGDNYENEPFGARFNYAIVGGQHTEQALNTAKKFIIFSPSSGY